MKMYFEKIGDTVFLVDRIRSYASHEPSPVIFGTWDGDFTERKMKNAMKKQQRFHQEPIEFYLDSKDCLKKIEF